MRKLCAVRVLGGPQSHWQRQSSTRPDMTHVQPSTGLIETLREGIRIRPWLIIAHTACIRKPSISCSAFKPLRISQLNMRACLVARARAHKFRCKSCLAPPPPSSSTTNPHIIPATTALTTRNVSSTDRAFHCFAFNTSSHNVNHHTDPDELVGHREPSKHFLHP